MRNIRWPLSVIFLALTCFSAVPTLACTIFTIAIGDTVLFGSNEDSGLEGTFITFVPADGSKHGYVYFSYDENDHPWDGAILGGMNDQGLCYDENWVPSRQINARPERPPFPSGSFYNYFYMFEHYATVREIEHLFAYYGTSYNYNLSLQAHWADISGDAAIASVGPDGDWVFTRRDENVSYLISTNWNRAFPMWAVRNIGESRERYNISQAILSSIIQERNLTVEVCRNVLNASSNEYTVYSNIFDLANRDIYLYFFHDFYQVLKLNLDEELVKGYRRYRIADLFRDTLTVYAEHPSSTQPTTTELPNSTSNLSSGFIAAILMAILIQIAFRRHAIHRRNKHPEKS
ncbi:MAG: hypothetical protein ACE5OZ_19640 [Candidatus Heimdallarchaeota archaeon]